MSRLHIDQPTLDELPGINAENSPRKLAFADPNEEVTWEEFEERSRQAAGSFDDHVQSGDRVAFLCDASVDHTVLWSGAVRTGSVVSHLHTMSSPDTVQYCIDELGPRVLVISAAYADFFHERVRDDLRTSIDTVVVIGESDYDYMVPHGEFVADGPNEAPDVLIEPNDLAVVAWTSGTTGRPKGWCHTHRTITLKAKYVSRVTGLIRTSTKIASYAPSFMAWYNSVTPVLLTGASLVLLEDWDPQRWAAHADAYVATHAGLVPTMWKEVLELDRDEYALDSFRRITFGGEKIDESTLERLREEICDDVHNGYASTEIDVASMFNDEMEGDRIESVGKPTGGTRVRIVEIDGSPEDTVPPNEIGEIIVKSPDCPAWAWRDGEKLDEYFTDGWWYPGDLGYKDEDGYLFLEGRKDFMIKSKGAKVFPAPIESALNDHPRVNEAIVVGVPDDEYGQKVTAIVNADGALDASELDEWTLESDRVARFERPREYHFVDWSIPRTSSNKLDRTTALNRVTSDEDTDR